MVVWWVVGQAFLNAAPIRTHPWGAFKKACAGWVLVCLDLWERFRFEGLSRFFFSFQTPIRACRFGQRKLTYTSGEAERGRGLIYSDERHR